MSLNFVGRVSRDGRAILGYLFLDSMSKEVRMLNKRDTVSMLKTVMANNIRLDGKTLVWDNGSVERYPMFSRNVDSTKQVVVIRKVLINGAHLGYDVLTNYDVVNNDATILRISSNALYKYLETNSLANGRFVDSDGKTYIAPIKGEFDEIDCKDERTVDMKDNSNRISLLQFASFMNQKGCKIEIEDTLKIEIPEKGMTLEYLKLPISGGKGISFSGGKLKVENMTVVHGEIRVTHSEKSGNNIIISKMHLFNVAGYREYGYGRIKNGVQEFRIKADVDRLILREGVKEIDNVDVEGKLRVVVAEGAVHKIQSSFRLCEPVELVDFRRATEPVVFSSSFLAGAKVGGDCKVIVPKISNVGYSFRGYTVDFQGEISTSMGSFTGFTRWKNKTDLDFSGMEKLEELGGMEYGECTSVKLPKIQKKMDIKYNFAQELNLKEVMIDVDREGLCEIGAFCFAKTQTVYLRGNVFLTAYTNKGTSPRYIVLPIEDKKARMPMLNNGSAVSKAFTIEFEEGIEEIERVRGEEVGHIEYDDYFIERFVFPSSLKKVGPGLFKKGKFRVFDIKDTQLEEIPVAMLRDSEIMTDFIICPKTVKKIGDSAFQAKGLQKLYIPDSVEEIGNNIFGGSVLLLHKGSYADKRMNGKYVKVYVDSYEEAIEQLTESVNTKRDIAKVKMTMSGDNVPDWMKKEEYAKNAKLIMDLEKKLQTDSISTDRVELYTTKFIDFSLDNLGDVGKILKEKLDNEPVDSVYREVTELTDRFKVLSNLITANTKFYAGAFTSPLLSKYNESVDAYLRAMGLKDDYGLSSNRAVLYKDSKASIVVLPLKPFNIEVGRDAEKVFYGIFIVIEDKIKYVTVCEYSSIFAGMRDKYVTRGFMNDIEDWLEEGDQLHAGTFKLARVPEMFHTRIESYYTKNLMRVGNDLISLNTGKLFEVTSKASKEFNAVVSKVKEVTEHRFKMDGAIFKQDLAVAYFNKMNDREIGEIKGFEAKKFILSELSDKYRANEMSIEEVKDYLIEKDACKVRITRRKFVMSANSYGGDYKVAEFNEMTLAKRIKNRLDSQTYIIANKTDNGGSWHDVEKISGVLSRFHILKEINRLEYNSTDNTEKEYRLLEEVYAYAEVGKRAIERVHLQGNWDMLIGKADGLGYLCVRASGYGAQTIVGIVRDIDEFMTWYNTDAESENKMIRVGDMFKNGNTHVFEEAWLARQGKIKAGLYPEYAVGNEEFMELIGL